MEEKISRTRAKIGENNGVGTAHILSFNFKPKWKKI